MGRFSKFSCELPEILVITGRVIVNETIEINIILLFGCLFKVINMITGKPVLTDTRDRRTLAHNGQFLKVPNFFFIFYCNIPFNKRTLPYPYKCIYCRYNTNLNSFHFEHSFWSVSLKYSSILLVDLYALVSGI